MKEFIEVLKFVLPPIVVFFAAYLILKKFVDYNLVRIKELESRLKNLENKSVNTGKDKTKEVTDSLRLQAYERLTLLLERINPSNLIVREMEPGLNAAAFYKKLLNTVQSEFEHNITQQIYVSETAWNHIKNAKEEVLSLINESYKKVKPNDTAIKLGETILANVFEEGKDPVLNALSVLKSEMRSNFIN